MRALFVHRPLYQLLMILFFVTLILFFALRLASNQVASHRLQTQRMHDSGHGMLFTTHDGRRMLVLHNHNHSLEPSNPVFLPVVERDGKLSILREV